MLKKEKQKRERERERERPSESVREDVCEPIKHSFSDGCRVITDGSGYFLQEPIAQIIYFYQ